MCFTDEPPFYIPQYGEYAYFGMTSASLVQQLGVSVQGIPMAEYTLNTQYLNSAKPTGKYRIHDPRLKVRCHWFRTRTILEWRVRAGYTVVYDVTGRVTLNPDGPGGGGPSGHEERGWAYHSSASGSSNGTGVHWADALLGYIEDGVCIVGWEIRVDGDQKCDAYGNLMS